MDDLKPLVLSTDLSVHYPRKPGVLTGARVEVHAGEIAGLVGESGSGKSTLALAVLRLLDHTGAKLSGRIELLGRDLLPLKEAEMRSVRGRLVSLVPQSPAAALNPALRIGNQLREAWLAHSRLPWRVHSDRALSLMAAAGLPHGEEFLRRFPSEISVGQAQRVCIVMALLHAPPLLIADEATSALDLVTQREVLELFAGIGRTHETSVLFISHDLPAVASVCTSVSILHDGRIVEDGPVDMVFRSPRHPYTKQLVAAVPKWT